jgi:protein involved in polysaccharide export with SLBB domain
VRPFGYDLFRQSRRRFDTSLFDVPVPADYVIGPGDTINVQLYGSENREDYLTVSREGTISFPEIGPITVSGLSFDQMRETIEARVSSS